MNTLKRYWYEKPIQITLLILFIGSIVHGIMAGELTLVQIESSTL
ncbi:MAG: hypothetical protein V1799_16295 [bacterium]